MRLAASCGAGRSTIPRLVSRANASCPLPSSAAGTENAARQGGGSGPASAAASSGPGSARSAARAAPVVEQQHRWRESLARLRVPASGDPQQYAAAGDARSKRSTSNSGARAAHDRGESRSESARTARASTARGCHRRRDPHALWIVRRELVVRGCDRLEEVWSSCSSRSGATIRDCWRERAVIGSIRSSSVRSGFRPPVANALSRRSRDAEAAAGALVGERGVDEAVEQHPGAGSSQGRRRSSTSCARAAA